MNRDVTKEDIQKSNKNIKRCIAVSVIRKMEITTKLKDSSYTPVTMAKLKIVSADKDAGQTVLVGM